MHSSGISDKHVYWGEGALSQLDTLFINARGKHTKKTNVSTDTNPVNRQSSILGLRRRPMTEKCQNILLFTDRIGFDLCGAADYFKTLEKKPYIKKIKKISYSGSALPIDDIEKLYMEIKAGNTAADTVDVIIAVGGGTIIDLAKIISIAYSNHCEKAEEVLDNNTLENKIPLIFIPTTAGTGSETTSFAVVYRDKVKISIERKSLLPDAIILDPLLLRSLPEPVLHSTILDALAQATESIWAVGSTAESKEYSSNAIPLILDNIDKGNTHSIDRLSSLQQASYWAGKAINISKTTLPHSISYPITAHFGIPHGTAVFLTLPEVAALNHETSVKTKQEKMDIDRIGTDFSLIFDLYGVKGIKPLQEKLKDVMVRLKVKTRLRDYGIKEEDLGFIASNALTKGRSDNNPRKMSEDDVLKLLRNIF
jgi:alcohol dehydrogenase class IV